MSSNDILEGFDELSDKIESDRKTTLRMALAATSEADPDRFARAERIGMPPRLMAFKDSDLEGEEQRRQLDQASRDPRLGDWLSDHDNMSIARDDVPMLRELAQAMSLPHRALESYRRRQEVRNRPPGFYPAEEPGLVSELIGEARAGWEQGRSFTLNLLDMLPGPKVMDPSTGRWTNDRTAESAALIAHYERRAQAAERPSSATQEGWHRLLEAEQRGAGYGELAMVAAQNPRTVMTTVARSLGSQLPQLALSASLPPARLAQAGTAGATAGLLEAGATILDDMQDDGVDTTNTAQVAAFLRDPAKMAAARQKASRRGVAVGTFDALTAGVAGRFLANARRSVRSIATRVAAEGTVQGVGGMAGEATAQALTGEHSRIDILMEGLAEVPTFLAEGRSQITRARWHAEANQEHHAAQDERQALDKVVSLAQSSRTRERSPERFEQLIGQMTQEGADTVYLPAEAVLEHYRQADQDPRQALADLTGDPNAFTVASETGAELAVPLARYATRITPEAHQALSGQARLVAGTTVRPATPTISEDEAQQTARQAAESVAGEYGRADDDTAQIFDSYHAQLAPLAGDSAARHYAGVMAQFHRTLGQRLGIAPRELHERFPITVQRPDEGPASVTIERGQPGQSQSRPGLLRRAVDAVRSFTQSDRGRIDISTTPEGERSFRITLNEDADYSTFLHEAGHAFLEIFGDLAEAEAAPAQVRQDWQTILRELGVEGRDQIGTDQHEQWARMAEAYFREGRAPAPALRRAFARFKVMLMALYRTLADLNVQLSDDARSVLDRMLATDEEIAMARATDGLAPLFADAAQAGMNAAEFEAYRRAITDSRTVAAERVAKAERRAVERETRAWWTAERNRLQTNIAEQLAREPVYLARRALWQMGEEGDKVKLAKPALEAMGIDLEPLRGAYVVEGGMHPDAAAELFGFDSGQAMLAAVVRAPKLDEAARTQADEQMRERHPLPDREVVVGLATHNPEARDLLVQELRALETRARAARAELGVLQESAERIVDEQQFRRLRPESYRLAEQSDARAASQALANGDLQAALLHQRRRLINHELYRAATAARLASEKQRRFIAKFSRGAARGRLGHAGGDYLAQIDAILDRFDFRTITNRDADHRRSLADWITAQEEAGYEVNVPEKLRSDAFRKPWRDLTVAELREVYEAVVQIDHLSKTKSKILEEQEQRDFDQVRDGVVQGIESHHRISPEEPDYSGRAWSRFRSFVANADAWLRKPEFVFTWLDGEQANGAAWRAMFKPLADAEAREQTMMKEASRKLREILLPYRGMGSQRVSVFGVGTFNKPALLSIALNWGNEGNREALMRGRGWSRDQVNAALAHLTDQDWDTVERIWSLVGSYWPEISKLQKEMTGLAPERVRPSSFTTPHNRFIRGGYYPLKYDSSVSERAHTREAALDVKEQWGGTFARAQTRQGHTVARTSSGGQPVKLDLGVLTEHVGNVIHDLTHRKAVMDVARLIGDGQVREAIKGTAGTAVYRQLKPWLQAIAADTRQPINYVESFLRRARVGATMVNMGWKVTTAVVQPLGILQSTEMIGERWTAIGVKDFFTSPRKQLAFAMERSKLLPHRMTTFDRDVKDTLGRVVDGSRLDDVRRTFFIFTGLTDMSVVVPTWLGAYRKAMEGQVQGIGRDNEAQAIDYADQVVRMTQSSGSVKDLAQIQRGHEMMRLVTMFYSYFNVLYNLMRRRGQAIQSTRDLPRLAATVLWLWFVPTVLSELIAGRGPDDDEEWGEWFGDNAGMFATYPLQAIPLLRDAVNAVVKPQYGYELTPAADAIDQTARTLGNVPKLWNDEEIDRGDVKAAVMAASYWGGLPGRQLWVTGEYLHDVATGEEQPESVLEFVEGAAFAR